MTYFPLFPFFSIIMSIFGAKTSADAHFLNLSYGCYELSRLDIWHLIVNLFFLKKILIDTYIFWKRFDNQILKNAYTVRRLRDY